MESGTITQKVSTPDIIEQERIYWSIKEIQRTYGISITEAADRFFAECREAAPKMAVSTRCRIPAGG